MARKGKKTMPEQQQANQTQGQGQPQAQAQAQAHQVEQHLVAAGLPQQALDTARARGLNVQQVLSLVGQFLPLVLQLVDQIHKGQPQVPGGTPGGSQISQPSGQQTTQPTQP